MLVRCPHISKQLLNYLDAAFPDRAVNPADMNADRAYGRVEVVRHLKAVAQTQEEDPDVSFET